MTVAELIEQLETQDPEAEIQVESESNYYVTGVTNVSNASFVSNQGKWCPRVCLSDKEPA